ncbi:glucuronosyltransferase [Brevundimonas sp.]|uniref:glucuronosyltransferase n=1 Tax=Brevundimonas sp. TaxID=1871086 RepID=UPI0037BEB2AE
MLLRTAFTGHDVVYANTIEGLAEKASVSPSVVIADCNRDDLMSVLRCVRDLLKIFQKDRPDIVVTTGAAPGVLALAIGRLHGSKGIWIDSVANSERLSLSGRMARRIAALHLTQWEHLADEASGTHYLGSVL